MAPSFRPCTALDLESLAKLSRETFIAAFGAVNDPLDLKTYIDRAFHPKTLERELDNPDSLFYFALEGENILGYFKLNRGDAQTEDQGSEAMELERLYVLETHQGKGLGSLMLKEVIQLARGDNKKRLWLGVWQHNPGAIRLYLRHNFQKFGQHFYFIGSDRQTDWLMRLEL